MNNTPVKINDIVYIAFPNAVQTITNNAILITSSYRNSNARHPIATNSSIVNAQAYILLAPYLGVVHNYDKNYVVTDQLLNGSYVSLQSIDTGEQLSNWSGDSYVQLNGAQKNPSNIWQIHILNGANNTPLTYGTKFYLTNLWQSFLVPSYDSSANTNNGNISISNSQVIPASYMVFLPGAGNGGAMAYLYCCKNDPVFTNPVNYCGDFYGKSYNGSCDTILSNYCASVTDDNCKYTDPLCGCLLPAKCYGYTKENVGQTVACVDNRCTGEVNAYLTKNQYNTTCETINCNINFDNSYIDNVNKIIINQKCGSNINPTPPIPPNKPTAKNYSVYLIVAALVIVILIIGGVILAVK